MTVTVPTGLSLTGSRETEFRFEVLDSNENYLYDLTAVEISGGSLTYDAFASVRSVGRITVEDLQEPDIDWLNVRLRISIIVNGEATLLGVFLCSVPTERWTDEGRSWAIELMDKLSILDQDTPEDPESGEPWHYSVLVDSPLIQEVIDIIQGTGESTPALQPDDVLTPNYLFWDIGTSRLKIINDLLEMGGYYPLWCDGQGQYRTSPFVRAAERDPVYSTILPLGDGPQSVTDPSWSRTLDWYDIPNRYIAYKSGDEEVPPGQPGTGEVGVATNENPDDPLSYVNRGRWVTRTETGVEATDLNLYAQQKLDFERAVYGEFDIAHAYMPELVPNATVRVVIEEANLDVLCVITKTDIPLDPLSLCRTTLMEVPL